MLSKLNTSPLNFLKRQTNEQIQLAKRLKKLRQLEDDLQMLVTKDEELAQEISIEEFSTDSVVLWKYLRKWHKRRRLRQKFTDAKDLAEHLDKVEKELIGKFKVEEAYATAPLFAKQIIKHALPNDSKIISQQHLAEELKIKFKPAEKVHAIMERRGQPKKFLDPIIAQAVKSELVGEDNLLVEDDKFLHEYRQSIIFEHEKPERKEKQEQQRNKLREDWENLEQQLKSTTNDLERKRLEQQQETIFQQLIDVYTNLFLVDKTTKLEKEGIKPEDWKFLQRIILDARIANALIQNEARMELFSLEALLQRVGSLFHNTRGKVYASQADLRHWFHQIKLPRRYRKFFRINLNKGECVFPRCWPMGFHMSPGIAQACTWSILLRDVEKNKSKLRELGIEWDENKQFNEYLQWLPLKDGGAVFVCIDNIFIITPSETVFRNWQEQILESSKLFDATLKKVDKKDTEDSSFRTEERKDEPYFFETKIFNNKKENKKISFCGVDFSAKGRRTKNNIDRVETLAKGENWEGTYRELAAIIGQILWTYRVQGTRMIDLEDFLGLYKFSFPNKNEKWDDKIPKTTTNDDEFQKTILKHYNACNCEDENRRFTKYEEPKNLNIVCYIATDAALEEKAETNNIGAMYCFSDEPTTKRNPYVLQEPHHQTQIALAELEAVVETIKRIMIERRDNPPDIFMIGIDSMAAKGMISRGFSKVKEARTLLKALSEATGGRKIFLHWVKSELNPADAPSRDQDARAEANMKLWKELQAVLEEQLPMAKTLWVKEGKNTTTIKSNKQQRNNPEEIPPNSSIPTATNLKSETGRRSDRE